MSVLWTHQGVYRPSDYQSEADLESAILEVQSELFGPTRIYLDIKKRIGSKTGLKNIPDGYLIDLSGRQPRLYVVENELAAHDPLRHIAVQILQFSLSFEAEPRVVKSILFDALTQQATIRTRCETYAQTHSYRNLDHLLEYLVYESPFAALVIIDELPENLENVLARKFQFGVEVIELGRFQNGAGERMYHFEPFLADVVSDTEGSGATSGSSAPGLAPIDLDTVVVPAREGGFDETFVGENRWHAVRIHGTMRPQIKYCAAYRTAPVSAITHMAPVKSIEPWKDSGKYVLNFSEPAHEIRHVDLAKGGRVKGPQSLRYTTRERLLAAKTLDDVW